uniref:NADP-dependent oxidoreductase domain-containing protein n=1 Tax=Bionectria ochroleuca TaxID=29856 RepID=A0A8H7KAJ5_BIOOC
MASHNPSTSTFKLNNGNLIPAIGLGTWQSADSQTRDAVSYALQHGYRHIDTALNYQNEKEVGEGIRMSGIPRKDIWVTTKLDNPWHHRALEGLETSLKDLGLDYIDLFLIHFPCSTDPNDSSKHLPDWDYVKTWQEMQKMLDSGKVKNIGVSNFQIRHLEKLLSDPTCKVVPAVNQLELHPYNPSSKLLDYCKSKGIHCTAYSCLGGNSSSPINKHTNLSDNLVVEKIAKAKGKSSAQILLKWGLQRGTSVIPKSVTPSRISSNFDLDGWDLSDAEVAEIDAIPTRVKVVQDDWMPIKVFFGDDE